MGGESDLARQGGKQGVIRAFFDVFAWVDSGAALADYNHAGFNYLAIMDLYA